MTKTVDFNTSIELGVASLYDLDGSNYTVVTIDSTRRMLLNPNPKEMNS